MIAGCGARCRTPLLDTIRWVRENAALAYVGISTAVTLAGITIGHLIGGA